MIKNVFIAFMLSMPFSLSAYEFSIMVNNKTEEPFSVNTDGIRIPSTKFSDECFFSKNLKKPEISGGTTRYFVSLSISDYKVSKNNDVVCFMNHSGKFNLSFSKPSSAYPCPYPMLSNEEGNFSDSFNELVCGIYKITRSFNRTGCVITIEKNIPFDPPM
jgi:hypothetical protein